MADPVAGMLPGLISDDPAARNEATLALRAMETQPGFSAHLLQLAASRELPPRDRWVAHPRSW
ncbi:hypothetical protein T484DRAFT_1840831 [Baffinella frigidus]|nr:hypothetical protein T484DRAFT_1840831 [Cryptophyta sp. CCMP2293]